MSWCFALLCNDAGLFTTAQAAFRQDLTTDDGAPHGWGLGYYQGGQPLLRKQPTALKDEPLDFCKRTESIRSNLVIGHVRADSKGGRRNENTQPFRFRRWLFCHLGSIQSFDQIEADVRTAIPDFMRRNIRGKTNSEVLFHLFTAFLNDAGQLDNDAITSDAAGSALGSAIKYVDRLSRDSGSGPMDHCCIATNGQVLVATHRSVPLCITRNSSYVNVGRDSADKPLSYPHLKAVVITGGRRPQSPGWESVDEGAVVSVDADLNIEYSMLA